MSQDITFNAVLLREPIKTESDDWRETSHHWHITINGQQFDYFSGLAHRERKAKLWGGQLEEYKRLSNSMTRLTQHGLEKLLAVSKAKAPTLDDVLYCLVSDADAAEMTFRDWCDNFGYDTDSRKAFDTYHACQETHDKLIKARINIEAQRERLQDY